MNWNTLLFSFEGRISRQPFWMAMIPIIIIEIAAHFAMGERFSSIVSLLIAYPEFAVLAKRGHDRNVPIWVAGIFTAGSVLLNLMVLLDLAGPLERPNTAFLVMGVPLGIMALILFIDFGFRRGTQGPNRYGPDPLAPSPAA